MQHSTSTTTASGHVNRRRFLRGVAGLGLSAAGLALLDACGGSPAAPPVAAETLETTTIRVPQGGSVCVAPLYVAEDLLKGEGFTNVQYVQSTQGGQGAEQDLSVGNCDMGLAAAPLAIREIDSGEPLVILSGCLIGCYELFGTDRVQTITDLKGKTIPVFALGNSQHVFLSSIVAWAGLDPNKDINWVVHPMDEATQLFTDGKVDAYLVFPPTPQELRAKRIGHVILNSMMDMPWSQYFCCMVSANQEFMRKNPVATKRALRAFLKATDIVAREPERVARLLVDKGYAKNYNYALQGLQDIPYNTWREYDPADSLRFYALRLRDAGMIKSSPDEIIAKTADWRFLNELKRELPAPAASASNAGLLCRLGERG